MTPDSDSPLQASDFDELDAILVDLASRDDAVPPWEFLEGAMAALICTRRPIEASEWMPALLGTGPLPTVPHGDGTHFPSTDRYERQRWVRGTGNINECRTTVRRDLPLDRCCRSACECNSEAGIIASTDR